MKHLWKIVCTIGIGLSCLTAQTISYTSHARPLFDSYGCLNCHGGNGGLILRTYSQVFSTGDHKPIVIPGDTNSILIQKLKGIASFGARMPLDADQISANDLQTIISWIRNGALENPTHVNVKNDARVIGTFELKQNYPNPFNPSTKIQFSIPESGEVRLTLHDISGKEIVVLFNEYLNAGTHLYQFNAFNIPTGVYFYRVQSSHYSVTKKFTLIK